MCVWRSVVWQLAWRRPSRPSCVTTMAEDSHEPLFVLTLLLKHWSPDYLVHFELEGELV